MNPFDLDKALGGDPIICRNGQVPSEWHYFKTVENQHERIVCVIDNRFRTFTLDGRYLWGEPEQEHIFDLMMAPKKIKFWTNVFVNSAGYYFTSGMYETFEESESNKAHYNCKFLKTQEIEI